MSYNNYYSNTYAPTDMSRQPSDSSGGSYDDYWGYQDDAAYTISAMDHDHYDQAEEGAYYNESDYTNYTLEGSDAAGQYYNDQLCYQDQYEQQGPSSSSATKSGGKSSKDKKNSYPCLQPGCKARPFARHADLERHIKHRHMPDDRKDIFPCDYKKCERKHKPFHRLDHCRDHYRVFHREDLLKRNSGSGSSSSATEDYYVRDHWYRCLKCLHRVDIQQNGFRCEFCKTECADERKALRGYPPNA